MPAVRNYFAGCGAILMFHEIHEAGDSELRTGTTPEFLDYILEWLKRKGWEIVSLDEGVKRIASEDSSRRFAVLTFDDGYRDNVTRALPVLERHHAPFTVFVPSGAPTRTLYCWWLGLRDIFRKCESVEIEPMGRRFECVSVNAKIAALDEVSRWIHQDYRRKLMLKPTFDAADTSLTALNESYFLDEQELRSLARHPLVSIGAHTSTHAALAILDAEAAYSEMADNQAYLEGLLQQRVCHFAYPYGNPKACGERDAALAAKVGFSSAVTTRESPLSAHHQFYLHALPRIGILPQDTPTSFDVRISGLHQAVASMLGRNQHNDRLHHEPRYRNLN